MEPFQPNTRRCDQALANQSGGKECTHKTIKIIGIPIFGFRPQCTPPLTNKHFIYTKLSFSGMYWITDQEVGCTARQGERRDREIESCVRGFSVAVERSVSARIVEAISGLIIVASPIVDRPFPFSVLCCCILQGQHKKRAHKAIDRSMYLMCIDPPVCKRARSQLHQQQQQQHPPPR